METLATTVAALAQPAVDAIIAPVDNLHPAATTEQQVHTTQDGANTIQSDHNAATTTSEATIAAISEKIPINHTDDFWSCCYEKGEEAANITKMVPLNFTSWHTSTNAYTVLTYCPLPKVFGHDQAQPFVGQSKYFNYMRCGFEFKLETTAPYGYAGLIAMIYFPPQYCKQFEVGKPFNRKGIDPQCMLNLPYVLLDIAKQNEVSLTVPYMNYNNYALTNINDNMDMGAVGLVNITNLMTPATAQNNITMSIFGCMLDLDLSVPKPPAVSAQGRRKKLQKRSPWTDVIDPNFMQVPQPSLTNILAGMSSWNAANSELNNQIESLSLASDGTALDWVTAGSTCAETDLVDLLRRWSIAGSQDWGDNTSAGSEVSYLNVDFSWGNFKHLSNHFQMWRGSLEVKCQIVAPNTAQGKLAVCWYARHEGALSQAQISNTNYVVVDAQGPTPTLTLPYSAATWRRGWENYGRLAAVVVNKFHPSTASSTKCKIVWFIRAGPDFQLFAPARPKRALDIQWNQAGNDNPLATESEPPIFLNFKLADVKLENKSHSQIARYFGRAGYQDQVGPTSSATLVSTKIASDSHLSLIYSYAFWAGEIVYTIYAGRDPILVSHSYEDLNQDVSIQTMMATGALLVPRWTAKSIAMPFYSHTPVRSTYGGNPWGHLYVNAPSTCYIFVHFRNLQLMCKVAPPDYKNQRLDKQWKGEARLVDVAPYEWQPIEPVPDQRVQVLQVNPLDFAGRGSLLTCGDVEENPGPLQLVRKNRGIYSHYGVVKGDKIYHFSSENILETILTGKVKIAVEDLGGDWEILPEKYISLAEKYIQADLVDKEYDYTIDQNCETWARDMVNSLEPTQSGQIKMALAVLVAICFFVIHDYTAQAGCLDAVTSFFSKITELVYGGFQSFVVRVVVKTVARLFCYLVLYAHSPNLLTTGMVATLIALDCTNTELDAATKKIVDAVISGKFTQLKRILAKDAGLDDVVIEWEEDTPLLQNQGLGHKDFNGWSLVAKNIEWWVGKIVDLFNWVKEKLFPEHSEEALEQLEACSDEIAITLAMVDEHLCKIATDKEYAVDRQTKERHTMLVDMLSGIVSDLQSLPRVTPLFTRANGLLMKLQNVTFEPCTDWMVREEPIGIWISGDAGSGKSFLAAKIAARLTKELGWRAYSHPTGSNHMDGYTDQEIHVFDDFGQCKEENEYDLICQLISSCPFIVPKADLTSKGTQYAAKVVIVTTNRMDFTSHKLYDVNALQRRFPFALHIKPREELTVEGRLDLSVALKTGHLKAGTCWMRNSSFCRMRTSGTDSWVGLNLDQLIEELKDEIDNRRKILSMMNQGFMDKVKSKVQKAGETIEMKVRKDLFVNLQEPSSVFDIDKVQRTARVLVSPPKTKTEKIKLLVTEYISKFKQFLERNRIWMIAIGALGSVITLAGLLVPMLKPRFGSHSPYDGRAPIRMTRDFAKIAKEHLEMKNQGKLNFDPIIKRMVTLYSGKEWATGLALGSKEVVTYGHDSFDSIMLNNMKHPVKQAYNVTFDGEPADLQIIEIDSKHQFKDLQRFLYSHDYTGNGFLMWKEPTEMLVMPVKNIRPGQPLRTKQGTISTNTYIYEAQTGVGSCGGVLVGVVSGNPVVLGIHTAGNGYSGVANRLSSSMLNQGLANRLAIFDNPLYFQPRKSAYRKSPVYVDSGVEPAVLSINDRRLTEPIEDITKKAAAKYVGNVFDPPPQVFEMAKNKVMSSLAKAVRRPTASIDYETATSGEFLPIDWQTSSGHKYQGVSKFDLVRDERFLQDVQMQLEKPSTYFVCYLKDELRPIDKVRAGKTRAIEACNFDFTVAFRMVMGGIYHQIYDDVACVSGVAVGINPYTHFADLLDNMYDNVLCLDFSGFDGSLSPQLMQAAVNILAEFHEDPALVIKMHHPVVNSINWVTNEIWQVEGGMCSGAPCTSVLNSVCNNLAAWTVCLSCGADPDSLYMVSYGDDIVISSRQQFDTTNLCTYYKEFFGMTATAADKTNQVKWLPKSEMEFLKRRPGKFENYQRPVGVLDLQSMLDRIQWTRGSFDSQLESFCMELALHGQDTYRNIERQFKKIDPNIRMPSYEQSASYLRAMFFDQGFHCEHVLASPPAAQLLGWPEAIASLIPEEAVGKIGPIHVNTIQGIVSAARRYLENVNPENLEDDLVFFFLFVIYRDRLRQIHSIMCDYAFRFLFDHFVTLVLDHD